MTKTFLEFREILWGVADGRKIPIKDLSIDHLVNILNWVKDRPQQYPAELHPLLEQEANYRKTIQFASGDPMPCRGDDGRWSLINSAGEAMDTKPKTDYSDSVDKSKQ